MKIAPIAFGVPRHRVEEIAVETSGLTHGHPTGKLSAAAWAELLIDVAAGADVEASAKTLARKYAAIPDGMETSRAILAALTAVRDASPETVESLGGAWTAEECLSIALYSALATDNLEDGLHCAVYHSGDSDSAGAVAGNLLGLMYPNEVFQCRWAKQIECSDLIALISHDLVNSRIWNNRE